MKNQVLSQTWGIACCAGAVNANISLVGSKKVVAVDVTGCVGDGVIVGVGVTVGVNVGVLLGGKVGVTRMNSASTVIFSSGD